MLTSKTVFDSHKLPLSIYLAAIAILRRAEGGQHTLHEIWRRIRMFGSIADRHRAGRRFSQIESAKKSADLPA
jgi:hypothetical protein